MKHLLIIPMLLIYIFWQKSNFKVASHINEWYKAYISENPGKEKDDGGKITKRFC